MNPPQTKGGQVDNMESSRKKGTNDEADIDDGMTVMLQHERG